MIIDKTYMAAKLRIDLAGIFFCCMENITPTLKYFSFSPLLAKDEVVREKKERTNKGSRNLIQRTCFRFVFRRTRFNTSIVRWTQDRRSKVSKEGEEIN